MRKIASLTSAQASCGLTAGKRSAAIARLGLGDCFEQSFFVRVVIRLAEMRDFGD